MRKALLIAAISMVTCLGVNAQQPTAKKEKQPETLFNLLNKHAYTGQYPLPKLPQASKSLRKKAYDASGQPFVFPDKVWFPGEWEEVKAVCVTPIYYRTVPGCEDDRRYSAEPIVEGWATYYFQPDIESDPEVIGSGPYVSYLATETALAKIFFYLMDGIQRGGAEAWVRIEQASDEQKVHQTLQDMGLRDDKLRFIIGSGNSYWFRDCGPICFYYGDDDQLAMLDFFYGPGRPLDDLLPSVIHRQMNIPNYISMIVWEGGNCLVDGVGGLVTSTAIYENNALTNGPVIWDGQDHSTISYSTKPSVNEEETATALHDMLGQRDLTILPRLKHEGGTGHMDLYADATDENGFLFAEMPDIYKEWEDYGIVSKNVAYMFQKPSFWGRNYYDKGRLPFPAKDDGSPFENERDYERTTRTYANHTFVNNYILQSCFSPVGADGMPMADWDRENIEKLKKRYPGYTFYCVDMRALDGSGGSIHCVTKQIPADNPIRILHKNIHGLVNPGELTAIPFSAVITNKSGIQQASLVYRIANSDEWHSVPLTANGNRFSCTVPVSDLVGSRSMEEGVAVDYYFTATSNNGKTITKPLNALTGSLYNFTLSSNAAYDEQMFDFSTEPMDKERITYTLSSYYLTEDTSKATETGIIEVSRDERTDKPGWYSINGTQFSQRPTAKGIYIHKGRKVAIQ